MSDHKKRILICSCTILLIIVSLIVGYRYFSHPQEKIVYYFYEEACMSCDREGEFYKLFHDRLQGASLPSDVHVYCYNQLTTDDELWQDMCDQLKIPDQERKLPMVIAGDQYAAGEENIYNHLRTLTCELYDVPDTGTIWYYYRPDCQDCIRIEDLVEKVFSDNPGISVIRIDTTEEEPKTAFKEKLGNMKVPKDEWQVPFLDNGRDYLSGDKAIEEGIYEFLKQ